MRKVALEMNVVPGLESTLVSVWKMAEADYITVLNKDGARIYDRKTAKITVSEEAIPEGYRCKWTGLWRVTLWKTVENENTNTIIINRPDPKEVIAHYFKFPLTEENDYIFPCMRRIPSRGNLDKDHPSRKLFNVAIIEHKSSNRILSGIRWIPTGPHERFKERNQTTEGKEQR